MGRLCSSGIIGSGRRPMRNLRGLDRRGGTQPIAMEFKISERG